MNSATVYIIFSILGIAVVAVLLFFVNRKRQTNHLTPLAGLAFSFVTAGIIFGENRLVGYSLMGFGVILAVIDIFARRRKK